MNRSWTLLPIAAGVLAACSTNPARIAELEDARTAVNRVATNPDAGVAAASVVDARNALDRADRLVDEGGDLDAIQHYAQVALLNAQIATERIKTHDAREEIDRASAERQAVLLQARERQARITAQRAAQAQQRAQAMEQRAAKLREELSDLRAEQTNRGVVVRLEDILFATDKATLQPGAARALNEVAEVLRQHPHQQVLIEGHTDSRGSAEYNQALSARRAAAVQEALRRRGVNSSQMMAIGRGESTPIASNENAGGRQENRRVELIFPNEPQLASDEE